ncbi:MAG: bacillithiol biosynthesis deacetylase BshB1 [Ignavibacteria bacterium]|nr:bacillithiol biosynthesis deacetylase BshB1 [Bacteroidota bacterium]MSQ45385.1 bacillithiol biosynthesis deacetylase BshB1 [Ignavibacteria bacterium]
MINMNNQIDVMAIGAHPDDVELSCGGTIAHLTRSGKKVVIVDLTQGELGTRGSALIRKNEAENAHKVFQTEARINLKISDGNIEISKLNVNKLINVIRKYRPKVLLIPHWLERHPDHEHAHRLCREAWFYSGLEKIKTTFEGKKQIPFRPHRFYHFMQKFEFTPSFIVDVSKYYSIKEEAIKCFNSQFYNPKSKESETLLSSKRFLEFIQSRDIHFGSMIGVDYGEPFYSIEPVGVSSFEVFI